MLVDTVTLANSDEILGLAATKRLPTMFQTRRFVDGGGLMSYGINFCQHFARKARYVDKILKGAKPSELHVELPTTFEFVVNMKSARALGLTFSPTLLARADEVIE